jgi:hypothetical protein
MGKNRTQRNKERKRKHFGWYMLQLKECLSRYIVLSKSGKLRTKDHPQTYEQGTISKEHQGEVLVFKRHFKKIKLNSKRGCWAHSTVCCSSRETFII